MFASRPDYLLKVRGESMRDAGIMDGDLLAVKKWIAPRMARSSWPHWQRSHRQALPQDRLDHRAAAGKSGLQRDYGRSGSR
jgi:hypothetical protein